MGRHRGGRTTLLAGWSLYNYYEKMSSRMFAFKPPAYFQAMAQAPPPFVQGGSQKLHNRKLVFPDDKLRRDLEKHSEHGRKLAREGLGLVGQWYTRRPFDQALARVKVIMKERQVESLEAIKLWDQEYSLQLELHEQEKQLLAEEARNSGVAISVLDSMNMLKVVRDMQAESLLKKKQSLERALQRLKSKSKSQPSEQDNQVYFERLIDLDKHLGMKSIKLLRQLNSSQIRKIAEAKQIANIVINIRDIKATHTPDDVYSAGPIIAPMDFLSAFIRAYELDGTSGTSTEWNEDRDIHFAGSYIDGERVADLIDYQYERLAEAFARFTRITTVSLRAENVMELVGIASGKDTTQTTIPEGLTDLAFGLREAVAALKYAKWEEYQVLTDFLPDIEELFCLLDLAYYIDDNAVDKEAAPLNEVDEEEPLPSSARSSN